MPLYQSLLVDRRIQGNQILHVTVSRQLFAKACQSTQARYSLKAQLSLRRQEFQQSQQQQMKLGPRLRVN